jgi:hypothetical protein
MQRSIVCSTLALVLARVPAAMAQTATLEGGVSMDSLGKRSVPGAEVSIPALRLTTSANFAGEYRLTGVTPGRYLVIATAAGVRGGGDSVTISAGTTYHDFVLATRAVVLDSVVSRAPVGHKYISPGLNGFEERRASGRGGYFIGEAQLRKDEGRTLASEIVAHIPDVNMTAAGTLLSGRTKCHGSAMRICRVPDCYVMVFVDGVPLNNSTSDQVDRPNFTRLQTDEYAGVEFYEGAATLPAQFSGFSNECGVLLLWTRER